MLGSPRAEFTSIPAVDKFNSVCRYCRGQLLKRLRCVISHLTLFRLNWVCDDAIVDRIKHVYIIIDIVHRLSLHHHHQLFIVRNRILCSVRWRCGHEDRWTTVNFSTSMDFDYFLRYFCDLSWLVAGDDRRWCWCLHKSWQTKNVRPAEWSQEFSNLDGKYQRQVSLTLRYDVINSNERKLRRTIGFVYFRSIVMCCACVMWDDNGWKCRRDWLFTHLVISVKSDQTESKIL